MVHPHVSILWESVELKAFLETVGVTATQLGSQGEIWAISNFKSALQCELMAVSSVDVSVECVDAFVFTAVVRGRSFPSFA